MVVRRGSQPLVPPKAQTFMGPTPERLEAAKAQTFMGPAPEKLEAAKEEPQATGEQGVSEETRHDVHKTHTAVDAAKLVKEAPHLAGELAEIIAHNPRLDSNVLRALVDLAMDAPDLAKRLAKTIADHPKLGKPILDAMPRIQQVFSKVLAGLKAEFPHLPPQALARITEGSVGRGIAKAIPVLGVGVAAWGTYDTVKAALDPRLSMETKARYAVANLTDWGAAVGGLFAETGVGEVAAIGAAVASIGLYAKAEASKEHDLEAHGEHHH